MPVQYLCWNRVLDKREYLMIIRDNFLSIMHKTITFFLIKRCRSVITNMSKRQRAIQCACALSTSNTRIAFCSIWEATPFKTNTLP